MKDAVPVELHGLEAALTDAWAEAWATACQAQTDEAPPGSQLTAEDGGEDPYMVSRTVTTHLIAVALSTELPQLEVLLERFAIRHPCRLFVAVLDDDDGPDQSPLHAKLSIHTEQSGAGIAIVRERITLHCPRSEVYKLPGIIRPLVDDDVPRHLYWHGSPPPEARDITALAELVSQVVLDSSTFDDPVVDLGRIQSLESEHDCRVRDLNWYRLRPWRRALATALEHIPFDFDLPTKVVIHHPDDGRGLAAALTLSAWLRDRLRASTTMLTVDDPGTHLEPVEVAMAVGDAFVRVHRMPSLHRLEVLVTLEDQCRLPTRLAMSTGSAGDLLAAAVDDGG